MQAIFEIDGERRTPKYLQIVHSVTKAIKQGRYKRGDRIFSINQLSNECLLSRDTVQKAYEVLERDRIIEAVRGKGFYVSRTDIVVPCKVLLVFNKLSTYKKIIYDSFVQTLGNKAFVELKIHHSNVKSLGEIIDTNLGLFDYYVIMPHFEHEHDILPILQKIPGEQCMVLDKDLRARHACYRGVFQDFEQDIVEALESGLDLLRKYNKLIYVQPAGISPPVEIRNGIRTFCQQYAFAFAIKSGIQLNEPLVEKETYIVTDETDLVNLVKNCQAKSFGVGEDIGILSYNESPFKEILSGGISVISTDHAKMGETAARLILENRSEKIKNPFALVRRKSL